MGAFTAGLDAGRIYNTWPLMNGALLPENATAFGSMWLNLAEHKDGVQFIHRNLAWVVAAAMLGFAWVYRAHVGLAGAVRLLAIGVVLQFVLGVLTLLTQVNIALGVLHQFGALLLLAALLNILHRTGRLSAT